MGGTRCLEAFAELGILNDSARVESRLSQDNLSEASARGGTWIHQLSITFS
ncbi:MAG: hypothetical protein QXX83_10705 [Thermofilum sp.]